LDLVITDEWGNIIQNYAELMNDVQATKVLTKATMGNINLLCCSKMDACPPLDPVSADMVLSGNTECIFYNESCGLP